MIVLFGICIFLLALYAAIIIRFGIGLRRELARISDPPTTLPYFSVIIPARNEQSTIYSSLASVAANEYPGGNFEVILVDDDSDDETIEEANRFLRENPLHADHIRILETRFDPDLATAGKKRAITEGIRAATGDWIVTTDADCTVLPTWLQTMAHECTDDVGVVSGGVLYSGNTVVHHMLALELSGLVAIGAGGIGLKQPNMANGANLAYRKEVFQEIGGFSGIDHVSSGDDELLVQKVAEKTSRQIRFCGQAGALVTTLPPQGLSEFVNQRKRWASKGLVYSKKWLKTLILIIYLFFVCLSLIFLALFIDSSFWPVVFAILAVKMISEIYLLTPLLRRSGKIRLLLLLPVVQLLQPFYITIVGFLSLFGSFHWKGRTLKR